ncbi:ubiquitinyl hydrolase 1 [Malassezia cuniculi]|uniref:Ubiquitin carboxyl-terminal hydrolase n=1 Tax=Malassezia cuniculi TaxID=948313 RepID=A0AAF0EWY1_9BASI|nr:ubiquitinyl hydrolase 1 [Malassezia cuniculi]
MAVVRVKKARRVKADKAVKNIAAKRRAQHADTAKTTTEHVSNSSTSVDDTIRPGSLLEALLSDPVRFVSSQRDELRAGLTVEAARAAGYRVIGAAEPSTTTTTTKAGAHSREKDAGDETGAAASPATATVLFSGRISLRFPPLSRAAGLYNRGNTCYLNSIMQALLHTPPLASALLTQNLKALLGPFGAPRTSKHALKAAETFNSVAALKAFFEQAWKGGTTAPSQFVANLRKIARPLRPGRQEDAHEYLRFLLESLQQSCVRFAPDKMPPNDPVLATTFVQRIFGGRLRSRVTCQSCKHTSDTYDPFQDLSLEVRKGLGSVRQSLEAFTSAETLSDKYRCEGCKKRVNATKQFTIESAPPVLTLHLKRFGVFGNKINRTISYAESLNIARYTSDHEPVTYKLYAVVHHFGSGPNVGHYVASVRAPDGHWLRMDDSSVSRMSCPTDDPSAYVLFYLREPGDILTHKKRRVSDEHMSPEATKASERRKEQSARDGDGDGDGEGDGDDDDNDLGQVVASPVSSKALRRELRRQKKLRAQARHALARQ